MFSVSTFPCPNCHEFINTSMTACKFCSVPVDPYTASRAVEAQEKINSACNGASVIRNMAGVMWICFFVRMLPLIGVAGSVGLFLLFFIIPVRLVHWQVKYGGLQTADVDYKKARQNVLAALALWLLLIVFVVVLLIFFVGVAVTSGR